MSPRRHSRPELREGGTGSLVVEAAVRGAEVYGVDVSEQMLQFTRRRAEAAAPLNIADAVKPATCRT
ncbi:MAG: hypothetical protein DLM60_15820 [Pseudonocardiales bacterium]|nr:hypothetical protein [Actinomycetota bacterium]PZS16119.1 MAG: hypothetical protein DLM60_15820 [Pseudonocardiales bacterium]